MAVYLIGRGIVTTAGRGLKAQVEALGESRVDPQRLALEGTEERSALYCGIEGLGGLDAPVDKLERLIEAAVTDALTEAGLDDEALSRTGIFVGSSSMDVGSSEALYVRDLAEGRDDFALRRSGYGNIAAFTAQRFGLQGDQFTFNTACSAGANALIYAARLLQAGRLAHALVLGVETLNRISLQGFDSLLLSSATGLRPFDRERDGLVLGEGVGAVLLAREAGGIPLSLCGGANLCDTSSATNSSPESIARVMDLALADAGVALPDILAVKAHGTGTPSNDAAEALGMRAFFGERVPPFTSLKSCLGHTLGGCGVLETLAFGACLEAGLVPATAGFENEDEALGLSPLRDAREAPERGDYLLNYFGFGGNNASLVLRHG